MVSCVFASPTIRSSLSVKVKLVMGFAVRGPRPRQLGPEPPPPPKVRSSLGVPSVSFFVERTVLIRGPTRGVNQLLTRGNMTGRFVVTTATKVSRTAQDPASWAPFMGSCQGGNTPSAGLCSQVLQRKRNKGRKQFCAVGMNIRL